jgi:hypothetical protein
MPYLHCPHCHRTAWVRSTPTTALCRGCGEPLDDGIGDVQLLAAAVRDRFARDAMRTADMRRFVRDKSA